METDQKKDRQGVSVKLPLMVMHKELGNVRADGHRRVYGYVCRSDGFASTEINIYCDGVKVAECRVARGGGRRRAETRQGDDVRLHFGGRKALAAPVQQGSARRGGREGSVR